MIKQAVKLEVERNGKVYSLHLPGDCPLGELHDVLYLMRSFVVEQFNKSVEADKPKEDKVEQLEQPKE